MLLLLCFTYFLSFLPSKRILKKLHRSRVIIITAGQSVNSLKAPNQVWLILSNCVGFHIVQENVSSTLNAHK